MSYIYKNDISVDKELFPHPPNTISAYFYDDPDSYGDGDFDLIKNEINLDVCDSVYAILTSEQLILWHKRFADVAKTEDAGKQYMATTMSWNAEYQSHPNRGPHFVLVIDEGVLENEFEEFCKENKIDCQFHVDRPNCKTEDHEEFDWDSDEELLENIYTGSTDNYPQLIRTLHNIQESK